MTQARGDYRDVIITFLSILTDAIKLVPEKEQRMELRQRITPVLELLHKVRKLN